jgi:hypothetical protein
LKSKKKMMMFLVLSLLQILIAVFIVVKRKDFIYLLPAKEPQVLRDLAYDKDKRLGYTIHIKEEGKLVPYLVLAKNYIDQGNVLLLRKHLLDPPMPFQEGWKRFYYGHSMIDAFMNKEFINRFPKNVQENIPLTELGIKPSEENAGMKHIEKIKRKLFLLSDVDVGDDRGKHRMGDDRNLLYFKRKGRVKEDRLAYSDGNSTPYSWWLRTAFATDSVVASVVNYKGRLGGNGVAYISYVRPAFTLPPETEVEEKGNDERTIYVLKADK